MNKSPLTLALSLATLLGAALLLPAAASAHDSERSTRYSMERGHHDATRSRETSRHQQRDVDWYLLQHHQARPYGYRPQQRIYRMRGHRPHHRLSHKRPHHHSHGHKHYESYRHSPVRLEIGYEIVL